MPRPLRESRHNFRIKENAPISWHVNEQSITNPATVINISDSGLMLKMDAASGQNINKDGVIMMEASMPFVPSMGRVVWSKKKGFIENSFLCGIEFVEPAQNVLANLRERIDSKIVKLESAERVKNIAGGILFAGMVVLMGIALSEQSAIRQGFENSSQMALGALSSESSLYVKVSKNLVETKKNLSDTQSLLAQAQTENDALKNQVTGYSQSQVELQNQIAALQGQNDHLSREVESLSLRLKPFEGELASTPEAKMAEKLVRNRLHQIKSTMHNLNAKAHAALVVAFKEKDRAALEKGNQGFLTKNGQNASSASVPSEKKIKIDVSIF